MLTSFLLPNRCPCRKIIDEESMLCPNCFKSLDFIINFCNRCGVTLPMRDLELCDECSNYDISAFYGRTAVELNSFANQLLRRFNTNGETRLAPLFAKLMFSSDPQFFEGIHMVTARPVPFLQFIHKGYNPASLLAKHVSKRIKKPLVLKLLDTKYKIKDFSKVQGKKILFVAEKFSKDLEQLGKSFYDAGCDQIKFLTFARSNPTKIPQIDS